MTDEDNAAKDELLKYADAQSVTKEELVEFVVKREKATDKNAAIKSFSMQRKEIWMGYVDEIVALRRKANAEGTTNAQPSTTKSTTNPDNPILSQTGTWEITHGPVTISGNSTTNPREMRVLLQKAAEALELAKAAIKVEPVYTPGPATNITQPVVAQSGSVNKSKCNKLEVKKAYGSEKPQLLFECDGLEEPLKFTKNEKDQEKLVAPIGLTKSDIALGKRHYIQFWVLWKQTEKDGKTYKDVVSLSMS